MIQIINFVCVAIVVAILAEFSGYYQVKQFKEVNKKIAEGPSYLADPERRDLCSKLLQQTRYMSISSILEARKLRKSLQAFQG